MKRNISLSIGSTLLVSAAASLGLAAGSGRDSHQRLESPGNLAYHDHLPGGPLPATLDASEFEQNQPAYVAYTLASQIRSTLYQVPCYCPCNKKEGHKSLLDCFTSRHGVMCRLCQSEAIYSYLQQKKDRTPSQIRRSMPKDVPKIDLDREVERLYVQLHKDSK